MCANKSYMTKSPSIILPLYHKKPRYHKKLDFLLNKYVAYICVMFADFFVIQTLSCMPFELYPT